MVNEPKFINSGVEQDKQICECLNPECEAINFISLGEDVKTTKCAACGKYELKLRGVESNTKNDIELDEILKDLEKRNNITLEEHNKVYKSYLHIEDEDRLDIVLAVALSNKMPGVRLWLILVGPSGDMKSVQLNAIRGANVEVMHNLTSKSLVNGFVDKKKYPDLAPKLNNKIVVISDMAQILKLPPNEKGEIWGQLRDLYDGFAGRNSGMGSTAKYEGLNVTLLAGSTPAIDGQILVHQDLGTREIIYRTKGNKDKNEVMNRCLLNEEQEKEISEKLKAITGKFLDSIKIREIELKEEVAKEIKKIAEYVTYMRCTAEFDNYTHELRNSVYPEEPTRITKQLKKLYVALKNLDENYSDEKALRILWHVGKSCAFPMRINLFDYLRENSKGEYSTSQLANRFFIGKSTVKRECAVMEALGLITCRRQDTSYPDRPYEYWRVQEEHKLVKSLNEGSKDKPSKEIGQDTSLKPSKEIVHTIHPYNVDFDFNNNNNIDKEHIPYDISLDGFNNANFKKESPAKLLGVFKC